MNTFSNFSNKKSRGFTLVESLVAISILLVAITAPLTLVVKSLQLSNYATTRMIAGFIAQDAFEYIRNIKDTNGLQNPVNPWLTNIPSSCFYPNFCAIDTTVSSVSAFVACSNAGNCTPLHRNTTTYAYSLNLSDPQTIFTRSVQIKDSVNNPGSDKFVYITVSWSVSGFTKSVVTQTSLLDWH
jgi:prepilin-type N-terminal cleavage/methylation domain-containing protein